MDEKNISDTDYVSEGIENANLSFYKSENEMNSDTAERKSNRNKKPNKTTVIALIVGVIIIIVFILIFIALLSSGECKHRKTSIVEAVEATCTLDGLTEGEICLKCHKMVTKQKTVYATGHQYDESILKKATCLEEGLMKYTCKVCGDEKTEKIEKHTFDDGYVKKEASCTQDGIKIYTCYNCGFEKTEETKATGHSFISDNKCTKCGAYRIDIDADCWYTYNAYSSLQIQNCVVENAFPSGSNIIVSYYPVCRSCHIADGLVAVAAPGLNTPIMKTYYCKSCGASTSVNFRIVL